MQLIQRDKKYERTETDKKNNIQDLEDNCRKVCFTIGENKRRIT